MSDTICAQFEHSPCIVSTRSVRSLFRRRWWVVCRRCGVLCIGPFDNTDQPHTIVHAMRHTALRRMPFPRRMDGDAPW